MELGIFQAMNFYTVVTKTISTKFLSFKSCFVPHSSCQGRINAPVEGTQHGVCELNRSNWLSLFIIGEHIKWVSVQLVYIPWYKQTTKFFAFT